MTHLPPLLSGVVGGSVEGTIVGSLDGSAVMGLFVGAVGDIDGSDVGVNATPHTTTSANCNHVNSRFRIINVSATTPSP